MKRTKSSLKSNDQKLSRLRNFVLENSSHLSKTQALLQRLYVALEQGKPSGVRQIWFTLHSEEQESCVYTSLLIDYLLRELFGPT